MLGARWQRGGAVTTRLFLDTCVLVDYFAKRESFFDATVKLRVAQMLGDVQLWCSAKSLKDVFYIVAREVGSEDLQRAFYESLNFLHVASVDAGCIREACVWGWEDFEDCLVALTAKECRADVLLTRDASGFEKSPVPVMTPWEYLERLQEERGIWYVTETL